MQINRKKRIRGCQYTWRDIFFVKQILVTSPSMNRKFIRDISANTLQVIIVQCCGLVIFYLLSTRLDKSEFGEINWALAVLLTAFGILAFGIDQISVKRFASGNNARQLLSIFCTHVLLAGTLFFIILWICDAVF
jgi:O-antigen/teichoic acid export membrane protein